MFLKVDNLGVGTIVQWETVPGDCTSHTKCPIVYCHYFCLNVYDKDHCVQILKVAYSSAI